MTGEGPRVAIAGLDPEVRARERGLPQPGGRPPAPGELVLLQSFLNSHFDLVGEWGADLLAEPERLRAWLSGRRLIDAAIARPRSAQVQGVIALREGLREMARRNRDLGVAIDPTALGRMNAALARASIGFKVDSGRLVLAARARGDLDAAVEILVAIAARAMIDGRWSRLKACPGEHCGWVFYDHSRNNSGRWCSMAACGGRTKARSHYRRRRMRGAG